MRKIALVISTLVAAMAMTVMVSASPESTISTNRNLIWSDEFNGTSLDTNIWNYQIGNGNWGWGNNEQQYYVEDNVSVSDGTLNIKAQYEQKTVGGKTYNWTSSRINTSGKKELGYGYVEARIKIPSSQGIWPAFWMLGTNGQVWPKCGEIDIMEAFNTKSYLQSTIHYPTFSGTDVYIYGQKTLADKTDWHTYGVYRDGNIIAFYIDHELVTLNMTWTSSGVKYATSDDEKFNTKDLTTGDFAGVRSVLNDDYYLLLNIACGGNLAGGNPPYTQGWNAVMNVDYVRYYSVDLKKTTPQTPTTTKPATTTKAVTAPKRATISSLKNIKKRKMKVSIKKISGVKGYQIRYSDSKKFNGYWDKTSKSRTFTIKKLDKKTTYYVKARAYKMNGKSKKYGKWSKVKKVKIKK